MKVLVVSEDPEFFRSASWVSQQLPADQIEGIHFSEVNYVDVLYLVRPDGYWEESIANVVKSISPDVVVAGSTRRDKTVAYSMAGKLRASVAGDVTEAVLKEGKLRVKRVVYSGAGVATLDLSLPAVITVQKNTMEPARRKGEVRKLQLDPSKVTLVERREVSQTVALDKAKTIVSVGRGIGSKENIKYAEELARALNAALGGSRPVTAELGWLPEDRQIGLSGNKVRPQLYIALGISGQPQHLAGIRDSRLIVAVNKDKNAPIVENADYTVIADAVEFCKMMVRRLTK
ncbi:MAG: electron transfer flavoprotein subunit alpha/FixB family protein [Metallosphaera yellowstonensis]|jgi:Electron transfer flavoprotein, alpha subunit|uniref:Electron transfer flavoprotein, alpha subunit n=1 Tax=Metallosphaera yellowstonensis MK1 TaxID=671065 RepID=H2C5M3_9CREN|nr:electron transfer flavoprotein subunit alpha/FixB family protein [Metallosphaera yellowstonensis]EHP69100.1 electron transfer flavoprotein, alpha subunit [Metallosphaera yellowstonensis MK1]